MESDPKVSVITVAYNSADTIFDTINSVQKQSYTKIEHVIIDGGSDDGTIDLCKELMRKSDVFHTGSDDGIYDAMNIGYSMSTGDIICFLNSDDIYFDENVISDIVRVFVSNHNAKFVYGDLIMISPTDGKIKRRWVSDKRCCKYLYGRQIPHPVFFARRDMISKLEIPFDSSLKISADLKQQLYLINYLGFEGQYLNRFLVKMSLGGTSTSSMGAIFLGWRETMSSYNSIFGRGGLAFTFRKVFAKISQFI